MARWRTSLLDERRVSGGLKTTLIHTDRGDLEQQFGPLL